MSTVVAPSPSRQQTLEQLVDRLGGIPLHRILLNSDFAPATEADVLEAARQHRLCELVDGVLVEKPMGYGESILAIYLGRVLDPWVDDRNLGFVSGPDGMMRLSPGLVRIPDVAFASWDRFPLVRRPTDAIPNLAPDMAVEILSESNTAAEMRRKCEEYFRAGVIVVWLADPATRTVRVFTLPDDFTTYGVGDVIPGEPVLPGFRLPVAQWFGRLDRQR